MSNAEGMRSLAQDITASYDARIGELASIRQQTVDMLSDFHRMDDERKTYVSNIKKEVSGMLDGFKDIIDGFKKEQEDTASAWQSLTAAMQSKREKKTGKTLKVRHAHHKGRKD